MTRPDTPDELWVAGVDVLTLYRCRICGLQYDDPAKALACAAKGLPDPIAQPGDVVLCKAGFGWYDGDPVWIANLDALRKAGAMDKDGNLKRTPNREHGNCFAPCCTYQFYYAVTKVANEGHRVKYWLRTLAISGGHEGGWTYDGSHYAPRKTDPLTVPSGVLAAAQDLIGKNVESLL